MQAENVVDSYELSPMQEGMVFHHLSAPGRDPYVSQVTLDLMGEIDPADKGPKVEGTLKQLAGIGYKTIEMCSPSGYEKAGFASLVGKKASELRSTIHAAGLGCESCHFQFREMKENLADRIGWAKDIRAAERLAKERGRPVFLFTYDGQMAIGRC